MYFDSSKIPVNLHNGAGIIFYFFNIFRVETYGFPVLQKKKLKILNF